MIIDITLKSIRLRAFDIQKDTCYKSRFENYIAK